MQQRLLGLVVIGFVFGATACSSDTTRSDEALGTTREALTSCFAAVDLSTLGGSNSFAEKISDTGDVVGSAQVSSGDFHAFLWRRGVMIDLGTLGGKSSHAHDVNVFGDVVGEAETTSGATHAFRWRNGVMTDLGTLGGDSAIARRVNFFGWVIGDSAINGSFSHGYVWHDGVMTDLGTLDGGLTSSAVAINALGQITGYSHITDAVFHGFIWQAGVMTDIGTLGGAKSFPSAINTFGEIVGVSDTSENTSHAFLWRPFSRVMQDLGTLAPGTSTANSFATDLNAREQVVGGSSTIDPNESSAFLWERGVMSPVGPVGSSAEGVDISERGQIVGISSVNGRLASFSWDHGVVSDLPPAIGNDARAFSVNDIGFVAGSSGTLTGDVTLQHATLWVPRGCW